MGVSLNGTANKGSYGVMNLCLQGAWNGTWQTLVPAVSLRAVSHSPRSGRWQIPTSTRVRRLQVKPKTSVKHSDVFASIWDKGESLENAGKGVPANRVASKWKPMKNLGKQTWTEACRGCTQPWVRAASAEWGGRGHVLWPGWRQIVSERGARRRERLRFHIRAVLRSDTSD